MHKVWFDNNKEAISVFQPDKFINIYKKHKNRNILWVQAVRTLTKTQFQEKPNKELSPTDSLGQLQRVALHGYFQSQKEDEEKNKKKLSKRINFWTRFRFVERLGLVAL